MSRPAGQGRGRRQGMSRCVLILIAVGLGCLGVGTAARAPLPQPTLQGKWRLVELTLNLDNEKHPVSLDGDYEGTVAVLTGETCVMKSRKYRLEFSVKTDST